MSIYKNEIKELSRELIWNHAIDSLTTCRESSRILNKVYLKKLWKYAIDENIIKYGVKSNCNDRYFLDWLSFSDIVYGHKRAEEIKIAFFCGPEPENDVNHLLTLGVRIENIYAFESDKTVFKSAIDSLRENYPTLKIYNGKIENFTRSNFVVFDIIYLDFTGSLLTVFKTVCAIFDNNALSSLGILAINTCYPDKTEDNINFLATYFHYQSCFEYPVYFGREEGENYSGRFIESSSCYGYDYKKTKELINANFEEAYSAFQTSFVINYSNHIKPFMAVINNIITYQRLFNPNKTVLKKAINSFYEREEIYWEPEQYALFHFFQYISNPKWEQFFKIEKGENAFSRKDSIDLLYSFFNAPYEKFEEILSKDLQDALPKINDNLPDKIHLGLFCDVPMPHLWLEQAINQLGYAYHINTSNHKRFNYTANTRQMCLDIFTFDQCRALYDWLPMIEYYGDDLSIIERQIISRMCMDAINKQTIHILENQYFGSALIGINERPWSCNYHFEDRVNLTI